jgi:hypothetical protein
MRTSASSAFAGERSTLVIHVSIIGVVIDSIGVSPNVGSSYDRRSAL